MAQEIKIRLTIDGKEAIATLDQAELGIREVEEGGKDANSTFQQIKNTAVGNFLAQQFSNAVGQLKALIKESEQLAIQQEQAELKVEQLVETTGMAAGFTAQQLKDEAARLQQLTTYGDEEILNLSSRLLTFKSIQGDIFQGVQQLALDTGEIFGSAESAILQYGKAFEDPRTGLTMLRRVGVSFTDQQKEQIYALQDNNQLFEAQNMLLDILQGQLGGVAERMADSNSGELQQFYNRWGDTQEVIGDFILQGKVDLLPLMNSLLDMTNSILDPKQTQIELLEQERFENERLITEIQAVNEDSERRVELINELKEAYPDLLENIDADKVSNEDLAKAMETVNLQIAEQIVVQRQVNKVSEAFAKAQEYAQKVEVERADLIDSLTTLTREYDISLESAADQLGLNTEKTQELYELRRVLGVAVQEGISLQEAELRIQNSVVMGQTEYNTVVASSATMQRNLNEALEEAERFLLQAGISQETVNEALSKYRGAQEEVEEEQEKVNEKTRNYSEELAKARNELNDLQELKEKDESQQERIQKLYDEIEALNDLIDTEEAREALRTNSFKPENEAPEDEIIEPEEIDTGSDLELSGEMQEDPFVQMYSERELAAQNYWDLQDHLMSLEQAKRMETSQGMQQSIQAQIEATEAQIMAEERKLQALDNVGRAASAHIRYAETFKDAAKGVIDAIAAEITALMVRNAIASAGLSGPAAIVLTPVLVAGAQRLAKEFIGSIPAFAEGGDFVTNGPQLIMVGDNPGGQERVQVTPMSSPNREGPQEQAAQVPNVVVKNFLTNEISPRNLDDALKEYYEIEQLVGN